MITVVYTASRRLMSGVTKGDIITLEFPAEKFELGNTENSSSTIAIGGLPQVSFHHEFDSWSVKSTYDEVNTKEDYEQFLYSTMGGSIFTMTDYDESDTTKNVIRQGDFNRSRIRAFNAGEFSYQFNCREV